MLRVLRQAQHVYAYGISRAYAYDMTYAIECRTPNGKWFVASSGLTAVEAAAYRVKFSNDPDVRIVEARS